MHSLEPVKRDLLRLSRNALLALFLIPVLSLLFIGHAQSGWDRDFTASASRATEANLAISPADRAQMIAMFEAMPPSKACAAGAPVPPSYRAALCGGYGQAYGHIWQFQLAGKTVKGLLLFELAVCLALIVLARMAFRGRQAQYRSLVLAWGLLAWSGALIVVAQSALLTWLSYWLTAWFFHVYSIKLVGVTGFLAGAAALAAVAQIFARLPREMPIDGELVREADAPALWARIKALAAQMGTAAPHRIVAGIDANFFVTEGAVQVQGRTFRGRSLYVSLPLLRVLDQREADAVLAHELAHFKGGDTGSSAALGPKLAQFDLYVARMNGPSLTLIGFYLLAAYRTVFEVALMRDSREREFLADRAAARAVHALPLMRALVKVAAYGSYRDRIEQELFERRSRHEGSLGIAAQVAEGLQPFARSHQFRRLMVQASVPHPFDSHPLLRERMANLKCVVPEEEFGQVLAHPVLQCWASEILTGEAIEARLWASYERQFAQAHEQNLAWRYLPRTEAERAVVEQYFPARRFDLSDGRSLDLDYEGLDLPDGTRLMWREIDGVGYEDGMLGDVLTLTLKEKGAFGRKSVKVKLAGIKAQRDLLKAALGQYWERHKVAYRMGQ